MGFNIEERLYNNIARNRSLDNASEDNTKFKDARYIEYRGYLDFNQQYIAFEKLIKKMMKTMLEKVVEKIRKLIAIRAFVLKIVNHKGWNIAAEIGNNSSNNLIKANKLTSVRQLAKNK
ncbi:10195_t:CDS:2 [Cetraspora pellucida]|uniref:10195_t:CDS:1 n=1 Tax=Cetraspora pellucida TaxID=1433469 RepID=A0A9N9FPU0_9GLOM|nr:10195_t:CDS:2 [Cetraspora pellucida]